MIDVTRAPDENRVIETFCKRPGRHADRDEEPQRGSGYLIMPGVAVTVRHAVSDASEHGGRVRVRQLARTGERDWLAVEKVITPTDPDLDIAVLLLSRQAPEVPDARVTPGMIDLGAPVRFSACGFPRVHRVGEKRSAENAGGYIRPDSEIRESTVALDVTTAVPSAGRAAGAASGWAGMSGAAVFGPGDLLVGVLTHDHLGFAGERLEMIPLPAVLADKNLAAHLPPVWLERPLPRVSNRVQFGLGSLRFQLAASAPPEVGRGGPAGGGGTRITTLLDGSSQIVPFLPREPQQPWLLRWCLDSADQVSYAVLSGAGGAGKSRLARWLCDHLAQEGWVTGLLQRADGTGDPVLFESAGRPALLVLDYADHRQAQVAELLDLLVRAGRSKVRILAIVRDGPAFLRRLGDETREGIDDPGEERHLALADYPLGPREREQHYDAAIRAFAGSLGRVAPADPARPELAERLAAMTTPLLVHAAALLDLLDPGTAGTVDPEDVLRALLIREDRFWAEDLGSLLSFPGTRRRVVAISTLVGVDNPVSIAQQAASRKQALAALEAAEVPADSRPLVIDRMRDLYERWLPRVEPDILGEQLIADSVVRQGLLDTVLGTVTSADQRSRLLEVLLRMCGSPIGSVGETARESLSGILDDHLEELLTQAVAVTSDEDGGPDARVLPSRLGSGIELAVTPRAATAALGSVTFPERSAVQALAAAVYSAAAKDALNREDSAAASDLEARAAAARTRVGQFEAAQSSVDRAMVYLSSAPAFSADASQPLARVLSVRSLVSTGLSRPGIALRDAQRGVEIVEELSRREPGEHASQLLDARVSLVIAFLAAGQADEALAVARRAVAESSVGSGLTRTFALHMQAQILYGRGDLNAALDLVTAGVAEIEAWEAAHQGQLSGPPAVSMPASLSADLPGISRSRAADLVSLQVFRAALLSTLDRAEEASEAALAAEETAMVHRAVRGNESATLLAQAKMNGATVVCLTDGETALAMAEEASGLMAQLYEQSPDVYGPYYVIGETIRARLLVASENAKDARAVMTRAARVVRGGFAARPALYLGALLMSALTLAEVHVAEEHHDEALAALSSAHAVLSRLDASVAPLARGYCALLLRSMADVEVARDNNAAAVVAAQRALESYSALLAVRPTTDYLLGRLGARLLLWKALAAEDRVDEFEEEALRALTDAQALAEQMPNDPGRRVLLVTRLMVAGAYEAQDRTAESIALLRATLSDFHRDYETSGDREDRDWIRQHIRMLETPGEVAAADASPEKFEDLTPAPEHRVVLGRYRGEEVAARPFRPVLVLGPQRSRKTTGVIIPALLEWDGPVVVTSVRDDVVLGSIGRRSHLGDGETYVFEPFGELFSGGKSLTTWNPVAGCEDWETAVRMAHWLTESARTRNESSGVRDDRFWYSQATLLLGPLLHAAALSGQTMEAVSRWTRAAAKAEVHARLSASPYREAIDLFKSFSDMYWSTRDGAYATLRDVLRAYESSAVRRNSATGFQPEKFFNGHPNTLYLCAPPHEQEQLAPIFTAFVKTILNYAYTYQGEGLNLLLLLDEAGNIAQIDNLHTIATTAAGTKIQLVTVFHDLSQMEAIYGPQRANNITNNHSALLILPGSRDEATMNLVQRIERDQTGSGRYSHHSVRQLKAGNALCVYENLNVEEITLRSSSHEDELLELAKADADITRFVTPKRR